MKAKSLVIAVVFCLSSPVVHATERLALIIGNSAYKHAQVLINPAKDADVVATKLRELGFRTTVGKNLSLLQMKSAIEGFKTLLGPDDIALFYFSGHGLNVDRVDHILPVDFNPSTAHSTAQSQAIDDLVTGLESKAAIRLVFIDAGHGVAAATRNLSIGVPREDGTMVMFAGRPGESLIYGNGDVSPFTASFVRNFGTTGAELSTVLKAIALDVSEATAGKQRPQWTLDITKDFFLLDPKSSVP